LRLEPLAAVLAHWGPAGGGAAASTDEPTEQHDPEDDVLDRQLLDELVELGPEFFGNLVGKFTATSGARIDQLAAAVSAGRTEEAARIAHSLRGSSGTLAARRLSRLAAQAEDVAIEGGTVSTALLDYLRREHRRAVEALTAQHDGAGTPAPETHG
jgi:HPt (histidine-containing phosphotransfer) domain-containing protein